MSLVATPGIQYRPSRNGGTTSRTLNSTNTKIAIVYIAPETGNLAKFWWVADAVLTSADLKLSIYAVDTATGTPTGSALATSVRTGAIPIGTWMQETLSATVAQIAGEVYCIVIEWNTGTQGSVSPQFGNATEWNGAFVNVYSGVWNNFNFSPQIFLEYDNGAGGTVFYESPGNTGQYSIAAFNATGGTLEVANQWLCTFPCVIRGIDYYGGPNAAGANLQASMWDNDPTTPVLLASRTIIANQERGPGQFPRGALFATPVIAVVGKTYNFGIKALTTNTVVVGQLTAPNASALAALDGGGLSMLKTTRTGSGPFLTPTSTTRMMITPRITSLSDGKGGAALIGKGGFIG